ncbi:uncharacterized protein LOC133203747 [Saccostrea echinata]|uniref:uncharacterized protein LOC133203747 n=1 Tax=Saccostrea echinata TaxID=191078 RepID=UPI002A83B2A0|nr:uncharacterized protein LOC133203747 [Saccostrea echinata]
MKSLLVFCVLVLCVGSTNACTCAGIPTNGCNSQYSILGQVIGQRVLEPGINGENLYWVRVFQIYKAERPLPYIGSGIIQIRAYTGGSLCGVVFTTGQLYVISGTYRDFTLGANSCAYVRQWDQIPLSEKWNLFCRRF